MTITCEELDSFKSGNTEFFLEKEDGNHAKPYAVICVRNGTDVHWQVNFKTLELARAEFEKAKGWV